MDKVLVDTNVASYLMKNHTLAQAYLRHLKGRILCLSFVSIGEFYLGAEKANWGEKKRQELEQRLRNYVVLPYEVEVARRYARVVIEVWRQQKQIHFPDAWIAATALAFELPLVTHNPGHFECVPGLGIITEYQSGGRKQ